MKTRRLLIIGLVVGVAAAIALPAWAYWALSSNTTSRPYSSATMSDPQQLFASSINGAVSLSWSAPGTGVTPTAYALARSDAGGSCTAVVTTTSCADSALTAGNSYSWTVQSKLNNWLSAGASTGNITVVGALHHFAITPSTTTPVAGTPFTVMVVAQDSSNRTATGFTGSVTLSISTADSGATIPGTYTFTSGPGLDNGTHTFSMMLTKATAQTITATSGAQTGTGTVTVGATSANKLGFTAQPAAGNPSVAFATQPKVAVQDIYGNTVATDTRSITLSIKSGTGASGAALTCTTNPLSASSGEAAFTGCAIDKVGSGYVLRATGGGLTVDGTAFNVAVSVPTISTPSASSPQSLQRNGTRTFTVTGTNFVSGATASISGGNVGTPTVTFNSSTQLSLSVAIASNASTTTRNLTLTNPDGGTVTCTNCISITS